MVSRCLKVIRGGTRLHIFSKATLGFVYTTLSVITEYLEYHTLTETGIDTPETYDLPILSYITHLRNACPRKKNENGTAFVLRLSNTSVDEIFDQCVKFSEILKDLNYLTSGMTWRSLKSNTTEFDYFLKNNVSTYIRSNYLYFEFQLSDAKNYNTTRLTPSSWQL